MKLTIVGCAGSFCGPKSAASCYLLQEVDAAGKEWNIVLDMGPGSLGTLQNLLDPGDLDAVVLSHLHPDHYLDVCGLEVYLAYHPERDFERKPAYAPHGLKQALQVMRGNTEDVPMGAKQAPFIVNDITDGEAFRIGPIEFAPLRMNHPVETYGFRIRSINESAGLASKTLVFTGDTDACPNLNQLAQGAHLLLCEAGYLEGRDDHLKNVHLTGKRAGEAAAQAEVDQLLLTHIPVWNDPKLTVAEAQAEYSGMIHVVEPLEVFELPCTQRLNIED